MAKYPGQSVRGSTTGRPIMVLFDVLGQRWTLRILWELRGGGLTFRELRERCEQVSPTVLNRRLKELRHLLLVEHVGQGYTLTEHGVELGAHLARITRWSEQWVRHLP